MPIRGPLIAPAFRLRIGDSVLSAARVLDTRLVNDRLARFEREHGRYVEAQRMVTAIDLRLRAARARLSRCDAVQDEAVESLARALVGDGHRIRHPFAAFGARSPSKLSRLPFADEAKAVHQLVRAVARNQRASKRTTQAARVADDAARAVEQAIIGVEQVEARLRAARHARDAIGRGWHLAYSALKRAALAAGDDGAPEIHAVLFAPPPRVPAKRKRRMRPPRSVRTTVPVKPKDNVTRGDKRRYLGEHQPDTADSSDCVPPTVLPH